jgi:hypothetical protein
MRRARERTEFDRWWKDWILRRTQSRVVGEIQPSGKNGGTDLERSTDARPCNSGDLPDAESGTAQ